MLDSGSHSAAAGVVERSCWLVEGGRRQVFEVEEGLVSLGLGLVERICVVDYTMVAYSC